MKNTIANFGLLILLVLSTAGLSQTISGNDKKTYNEAESFFITENYSTALSLYLQIDSVKNRNANINFKIGFCFLNSSTHKPRAINYLEEAEKDISIKYVEGDINETHAPLSTLYYLAKGYAYDYRFNDAKEKFTEYIERLGDSPESKEDVDDAKHEIECAQNALELLSQSGNAILTNLGKIVNSEFTDAAPVISLDEQTLIFTSKRFSGADDERYPDGQYYEDIYISQFINGEWAKPKSISQHINTNEVEAALNLSTDGTKLLIYKDDNGNGNIYMSTLVGAEWSYPKSIDAINSTAWETHACLSADERILYFVSDREGGKGGRDIYKSMKLPDGNWGPPQNLGDTINTKWDEDGIFVHPDGKQIFFSSKGHRSMGGFDIFSSTINSENGWWNPPVNVGAPINTPDDDIFYVTTPDGKRAYLSSSKDGGQGEKDIYMVTFPDYEPRDITIIVGRIVNNSKQNIATNKIVIKDINSNEILQELTANSISGKFGTNLPIGKSYNISYSVNNIVFYTETVEVPLKSGYKVLERNVPYNGAGK